MSASAYDVYTALQDAVVECGALANAYDVLSPARFVCESPDGTRWMFAGGISVETQENAAGNHATEIVAQVVRA